MRNVNLPFKLVFSVSRVGFILTMRNVNGCEAILEYGNIDSFILTMRNVNWDIANGFKTLVARFILTMRNVNRKKSSNL